jgi:hypothetical protein
MNKKGVVDIMVILLVIVVGAGAYHFAQNKAAEQPFQITINNPQDSVQQESNDDAPVDHDYWVLIQFNPDWMHVGDTTHAEIISNMPHATCNIRYKTPIEDWKLYQSVTLDDAGHYEEWRSIDIVAAGEFQAVCIKDMQVVSSDVAYLVVN